MRKVLFFAVASSFCCTAALLEANPRWSLGRAALAARLADARSLWLGVGAADRPIGLCEVGRGRPDVPPVGGHLCGLGSGLDVLNAIEALEPMPSKPYSLRMPSKPPSPAEQKEDVRRKGERKSA